MGILEDLWSDAAPGWASETGATPNINNGVLAAKYRRVNGGAQFNMYMVAGSSTTFGGGVWIVRVNVPTLRLVSPYGYTLPALAWDASADRYYTGIARLDDDDGGLVWSQDYPYPTFVHFAFGTNTTDASPTVPFTWAAGDRLIVAPQIDAFDA